VIFTVILLYLASLYLRNRNLKQDIEVLEEIEQKESVEKVGSTQTS
jgi:hypothetical protein